MAKISEIMLLQQPEQPALAIEVQTNMKGMSQAIGENFVRIDSLFKKQGEVTTDIPFVEYPDFESLTEDRIEMIIGLKSSKPLQGDEKIQSVILPARRIVVCLHRGNYNELAQLYNEMTEWIKTNGYKYVDEDREGGIFETGTNQDIDDIIAGTYIGYEESV